MHNCGVLTITGGRAPAHSLTQVQDALRVISSWTVVWVQRLCKTSSPSIVMLLINKVMRMSVTCSFVVLSRCALNGSHVDQQCQQCWPQFQCACSSLLPKTVARKGCLQVKQNVVAPRHPPAAKHCLTFGGTDEHHSGYTSDERDKQL